MAPELMPFCYLVMPIIDDDPVEPAFTEESIDAYMEEHGGDVPWTTVRDAAGWTCTYQFTHDIKNLEFGESEHPTRSFDPPRHLIVKDLQQMWTSIAGVMCYRPTSSGSLQEWMSEKYRAQVLATFLNEHVVRDELADLLDLRDTHELSEAAAIDLEGRMENEPPEKYLRRATLGSPKIFCGVWYH